MNSNSKITSSKCVYFDCTETYVFKLHSGIQRVVRNIAEFAYNHPTSGNYSLIPVICVNGRYHELPKGFNERTIVTNLFVRLFAHLRNLVDRIFNSGKSDSVDQNCIHSPDSSESSSCYVGLIQLSREVITTILKTTLRLELFCMHAKQIKFKDGDILLLADVFWKNHLYKSVESLKEIQLKKLLIVYDVIALTHPRFVDDINCADFVYFFNKFIRLVDGVLSISSYSLDRIAEYALPQNGNIQQDYFYLGADFNPSRSSGSAVRAELVDMLNSGLFYLSVGTVEPRKNYDFILDAFERLWSDNYEVSLCIVGKVGWKCDDLLRRIKSLADATGKLYCFHDLNDDELEYCYSNSKALVFASVVEGFGLPLVEAMNYGKPVIASDIPVFKEIGGDYPFYFPLDDPSDLSRLVSDFEATGSRQDLRPVKWITWEESVKELFQKVIQMDERISSARTADRRS